jgi:hypothetical protein
MFPNNLDRQKDAHRLRSFSIRFSWSKFVRQKRTPSRARGLYIRRRGFVIHFCSGSCWIFENLKRRHLGIITTFIQIVMQKRCTLRPVGRYSTGMEGTEEDAGRCRLSSVIVTRHLSYVMIYRSQHQPAPHRGGMKRCL